MPRLEVGDHVNQKGSDNPTGIIEDIRGDFATVRWGTADKKTWKDEFNLNELTKVEGIIPSE